MLWLFLIPASFALFCFLTDKYLNPYKLVMIFGKKGAGKTSLLVKLAMKYQRKGIKVYSTERIPGCYLVDPDDVGFYEFDPDSVLLIDEVSLVWGNRHFKDFKKEVEEWFRLQRHRRIRVFMFSQTFDVDKKIRDLTDELFLIEKRFRVFSYGKRIIKKIVLTAPTGDAPSKIAEQLAFDSLLFAFFGARILTYIPRYINYYDSFCCRPLKIKEYEFVPPMDMPRIAPARFLDSLVSRLKG